MRNNPLPRILSLVLLASPLFVHGWRSWYFVDAGADIAGIGHALTTSLSSLSSFDKQPASTGFTGIPSLTWEIATSLFLVDPLSGQYTLSPDPLPFLGFSMGDTHYGAGIAFRRIIASPGSDLSVSTLGASGAVLPLPFLRIGASGGIILAREYTDTTTGWSFSLGILSQIFPTWRVGLSWQYFSEITWTTSRYGQNVRESFPSQLSLGTSTLTGLGEWFGEIRYTDVWHMRFVHDELCEVPSLSPLTPWTLHLGWRGKLPWWTIPFHVGIFTDHLWTYPRPMRQWSLALGLRATGKNIQFSLTWIDNYLFSLIWNENQPNERGLVSLSYLF